MGDSTQDLEKRIVHLKIDGMTCQNCVRHAREALQSVEGVASVEVRLMSNDAIVKLNGWGAAEHSSLIDAIKNAGYGAAVVTETDGNVVEETWDKPLLLAVAVTAFFMLGEWAFRWHGLVWYRWLSFGLASIVQFYSGAGFYRAAWRQLKNRQSSMDTLVVLGSSTAYLLSVGLLVSGSDRHLHFMEAAAILSFIGLGHWLEKRASSKAEGALKGLMKLVPDTARRQEADNSEKEIPISQLLLNDAVVLRPGDAIPVMAR